MPYSDWVFALYGIGLFYLLLHLDKVKDRSSFRFCWFFYVGAIGSGAFAGSSTAGGVFRVVCWLFVVVSAVFLYFSIDPIFKDNKDSKD